MKLAILLALLCCTASAEAQTADKILAGLGGVPTAELHYKFEVTFMKIDVADIRVHLTPYMAMRITPIIAAGRDSRQARRQIAENLLAADTLAVSFRLRRDGGFDRFMKGMQQSLDYARKSQIISETELDTVWRDFEADMAPLLERGGRKGDTLFYRVEGPRVRMVYTSATGESLFDVWHEGEAWARGVKRSYLGPKSRFSKPLIRSLFETERRSEDIP